MRGTFIDCACIIFGGLIGTLLRTKLKDENFSDKVRPSLGLCAILVGVVGCTSVNHPIVAVIALVAGGIIGSAVHLEDNLKNLFDKGSESLKKTPISDNFVKGLISYSMLSIAGSMAIVGVMEDALAGDISLLITKTVLDFVCAVLFSLTYGIAICFSSLIVFLYQGMFAWLASMLAPLLTTSVIGDMSAIGSVIIFIVGLNLLKVTDYKTMDFVPAIFLPIILCQFI